MTFTIVQRETRDRIVYDDRIDWIEDKWGDRCVAFTSCDAFARLVCRNGVEFTGRNDVARLRRRRRRQMITSIDFSSRMLCFVARGVGRDRERILLAACCFYCCVKGRTFVGYKARACACTHGRVMWCSRLLYQQRRDSRVVAFGGQPLVLYYYTQIKE